MGKERRKRRGGRALEMWERVEEKEERMQGVEDMGGDRAQDGGLDVAQGQEERGRAGDGRRRECRCMGRSWPLLH